MIFRFKVVDYCMESGFFVSLHQLLFKRKRIIVGSFDKDISFVRKKPWLVALIGAFFVAYPNNAWLLCDLDMFVKPEETTPFFIFFFCRLAYIWLLMWLILKFDFKHITSIHFTKHAGINLLLTLVGFGIYYGVTQLTVSYDHFFSMIFFQFISIFGLCIVAFSPFLKVRCVLVISFQLSGFSFQLSVFS